MRFPARRKAYTFLQAMAVELPHRAREAVEGGAMLLAVVVTGTVFSMRRQAATIGRELKAKVDVALGSGTALALLSFSSVGREGLEAALFLFAGSGSATSLAL
jgi:high-affinity iron transporter